MHTKTQNCGQAASHHLINQRVKQRIAKVAVDVNAGQVMYVVVLSMGQINASLNLLAA